MSYRLALAFGWAIARCSWGWSLAVYFPLLVAIIINPRLLPTGSATPPAVRAAVMALWIVPGVFLVLPLGIRDAVRQVHSDFRVSVAGRAHRGEGLTYFESLQVSLLAFAIGGGLGWTCYGLGLPDRLVPAVESWWFPLLDLGLSLIPIAIGVLVVWPAIVAAAVRLPFLGFRISIVPTAPLAERGSSRFVS